MAGTAPVSFQSGQIHKVKIRRACNKHLRHTMHLFADHSRAKCPWAAIYYEACRQHGKTHAQALRLPPTAVASQHKASDRAPFPMTNDQ